MEELGGKYAKVATSIVKECAVVVDGWMGGWYAKVISEGRPQEQHATGSTTIDVPARSTETRQYPQSHALWPSDNGVYF